MIQTIVVLVRAACRRALTRTNTSAGHAQILIGPQALAAAGALLEQNV